MTPPSPFHIIAGWTDADDDERVMCWATGFADDMAQHATGGVYVNLVAEDEAERVPSAFSDHERLRTLKRRWDPHNVFCGNHNVAPG